MHNTRLTRSIFAGTLLAGLLTTSMGQAQTEPSKGATLKIAVVKIDDQKAVLATVEPIHQFVARARIGGTITQLTIKEGDVVRAGDEVGLIVDQKLALQLKALDERIQSQEAQRNQAQIDFERISELIRRGAGTQAQLDQTRTMLEVQERGLNALRNDKAVLMQQVNEGKIISPASGRVLKVPVVINDRNPDDEASIIKRQGKVMIVYPEIQGGRVIADIQVPDLGSYFVGERTMVFLSTGRREAILVPQKAVTVKAGLHYVTLASGAEVVVQPGERMDDKVEVLTGLTPGDVIKVSQP
jgi:multidrug efflux system membrane fusion protein